MGVIPVMSAGTPTMPVDGVDFAGDFGLSLLVLMRAYRTVVASALADVPQGARGYQTLAVVVRGDQQNQLALATYLGIDRTVMTYLIDDLVTAGQLGRAPAHPCRSGEAEEDEAVVDGDEDGDGAVGPEDPIRGLRTQPCGAPGERLAASDDAVGFVPHDVLGVGLRMAVLRRSGSGSLNTSRRLRRIRSTATVLCTDGPSGWLQGELWPRPAVLRDLCISRLLNGP
ncbi:hypothetical protein ACFV98_27325 [Streptomyces violascens]|uniref:hypothetical protein n=1 Tax=Streptomyces violascens TaxID=67381 RepID=UPI0036483B94